MRPSWSGLARTVVVAAAGAGVVLAATHAPDAVALGPAQAEQSGTGSTTSLVRGASLLCPGPELKGVPGVPDLPVGVRVAAASAPAEVLQGLRLPTAPGRVAITGMPRGSVGAPLTVRGAVTSGDVAAAVGVETTATQSVAPAVAAVQTWLSPRGDQRSLGSVPCGQAGAELWILAGGGAPGRQERLVLTNPGGNPVSVDVTLLGPDGPVSSSNGKGLVVPAHGRTAFLLDSISGDLASPAVHVVAQGGVVSATVNDLWLDGTRSAGSDDASPSAAPAREQVVPAVPVQGTAVLRVAVPGAAEAVVQARVLTAQGPRALPTGGVVRVAGGSVVDLDLARLPAGTVGLQVRADVPVVAGALTTRATGSGPGDLAWSASTPALTGVAGTPLPAPPTAVQALSQALSLSATRDAATVQVVTVDAKGVARSQPVRVAADSTATVPLGGAAAVWVRRQSGTGQVHAGVVRAVKDSAGVLITVVPLGDAPLRTTTAALHEAKP